MATSDIHTLRARINEYNPNSTTTNSDDEVVSDHFFEQTREETLKYINLLLIGEKGAGKSSLLSTFHRALHERYGEPPIAGVGVCQTQAFTRRKKGYPLNVGRTIIGHDTRGLESFLKPEIEHIRAIRDGKVADDVIISQKKSWGFWDYCYSILARNPQAILDPHCLRDASEPTTIQHIPHVVVFVVPANQRRVPAELSRFVMLFSDNGYRPLFAVTKIDCHGEEEGDLYAATRLYDQKKKELLREFDITYDDVMPIQNYTQWEHKEQSIESLALELLDKAIIHAEDLVVQYRDAGYRRSRFVDQVAGNCNVS
eukprot:gb/GECH01005770.1/.p1 GENE.gb/GECH01005770.1/~~gb/GECH01005770.1/.p1  ORF type:complete len:313 (+),score=37.66 gb/GECH01005770.1/:1-939(+)